MFTCRETLCRLLALKMTDPRNFRVIPLSVPLGARPAAPEPETTEILTLLSRAKYRLRAVNIHDSLSRVHRCKTKRYVSSILLLSDPTDLSTLLSPTPFDYHRGNSRDPPYVSSSDSDVQGVIGRYGEWVNIRKLGHRKIHRHHLPSKYSHSPQTHLSHCHRHSL